jgi:hypothetical protein
MKILYTRQDDGTYTKSGELPQGTKWVTIEIAGRKTAHLVKRVGVTTDFIETEIKRGFARADWYALVPATASNAMSDEAKEKLRTINAQKKADKEARE